MCTCSINVCCNIPALLREQAYNLGYINRTTLRVRMILLVQTRPMGSNSETRNNYVNGEVDVEGRHGVV